MRFTSLSNKQAPRRARPAAPHKLLLTLVVAAAICAASSTAAAAPASTLAPPPEAGATLLSVQSVFRTGVYVPPVNPYARQFGTKYSGCKLAYPGNVWIVRRRASVTTVARAVRAVCWCADAPHKKNNQ